MDLEPPTEGDPRFTLRRDEERAPRRSSRRRDHEAEVIAQRLTDPIPAFAGVVADVESLRGPGDRAGRIGPQVESDLVDALPDLGGNSRAGTASPRPGSRAPSSSRRCPCGGAPRPKSPHTF